MPIDLDAVQEMEVLPQQDHLPPIPSSAWHPTLAVGASTEDEVVGEVTGLRSEVAAEGLIWMIEVIATHAVGLRRVAGQGTVMTGTGWTGWIAMLTQIPGETFETIATLATANCSEIN
jgi:hypothetical protein